MTVSPEDLQALEEWVLKGDTADEVKAWHAQLILELMQYIRYLELELSQTRIKNADLDERIRLGT